MRTLGAWTMVGPRVVILGAGFAGLSAARRLNKAKVRITIVDRRNHHVFQPLLYQVATAALNPSNIATPIRRVLRRQRNAEVVLAEASRISVAEKKVVLTDGEIPYDYLILAAGASHSYFGNDAWAEFAPGLKAVEDALDIRRRVLIAFEAAEREEDPERRKAWLTFVIVGAGPTGVELAGALAEISRHVLSMDFRRIDTKEARILLVEGGTRVLPTFPEELSAKATTQLSRLGVEARTGASVTSISARDVILSDGEILRTRTVLWAAGVAASPLSKTLDEPLDRAGRVIVEPDLSIKGDRNVFVVGDLSSVTKRGKPVPGVAPAAMQGGTHAAEMILADLRGKPRKPFSYHDKGSLATIGRASAVADFGKLKISGYFAWVLWLFVHILFLIGFRSRFLVMFEWAWVYWTYERGSRLITGPAGKLLDVDEPTKIT